jgi:hypothetical protein
MVGTLPMQASCSKLASYSQSSMPSRHHPALSPDLRNTLSLSSRLDGLTLTAANLLLPQACPATASRAVTRMSRTLASFRRRDFS